MLPPTIQEGLFSIMCRFRVHKIVMIANTEKNAQADGGPSNSKSQRILFKTNANHLKNQRNMPGRAGRRTNLPTREST